MKKITLLPKVILKSHYYFNMTICNENWSKRQNAPWNVTFVTKKSVETDELLKVTVSSHWQNVLEAEIPSFSLEEIQMNNVSVFRHCKISVTEKCVNSERSKAAISSIYLHIFVLYPKWHFQIINRCKW